MSSVSQTIHRRPRRESDLPQSPVGESRLGQALGRWALEAHTRGRSPDGGDIGGALSEMSPAACRGSGCQAQTARGGALPQRPILPLFGNTWGPILWLSLSPGLRQYDNHSTGVEIEAQREERDLGG